MYTINKKLNRLGKPFLSIEKTGGTSVSYKKGKVNFISIKESLFLTEQTLKNLDHGRKFVLSLRRDGTKSFSGEYILTQMSLGEAELLCLKETIEQILVHRQEDDFRM